MDVTVVIATILFTSVCSTVSGSFGFGESKDRVLLRDIQVLTLHHGQMTTARRSHPIPQMKCIGGTAGCSSFVPQVVQCYNRGSDGFDVQWECKTDMDNAYRLGRVEVSCEGYEYPDDPYILRGSCGLEYTLDLTKEGYQKQNSHEHSYYGSENQHHHHSSGGHHRDSYSKKQSWGGDLVTLAVIAVIIYAIYKTCLSPSTNHRGGDDDTRRDQGRRWGSGSQPPPPGFRPDYMPGSDDCSSSRSQSYGSHTSHNTNTGTGGGGFWTGAATGGLLGYMFGNRNSGYNGSYTHHTPYARRGWGSGWGGSTWGGSTWGSTGSSGWGSGGGSRSSSSYSSGTRTASGFGGTSRR